LRHEASVTDAAFSRDGRQVASVDRDGVIKVWDMQTGREVLRIQAHDKPAGCVAFSPDGHYLATGSQDRTIKIWDVATRQSIRILQGHQNPLESTSRRSITAWALQMLPGAEYATVDGIAPSKAWERRKRCKQAL
jgi:WD40 repeat protein